MNRIEKRLQEIASMDGFACDYHGISFERVTEAAISAARKEANEIALDGWTPYLYFTLDGGILIEADDGGPDILIHPDGSSEMIEF